MQACQCQGRQGFGNYKALWLIHWPSSFASSVSDASSSRPFFCTTIISKIRIPESFAILVSLPEHSTSTINKAVVKQETILSDARIERSQDQIPCQNHTNSSLKHRYSINYCTYIDWFYACFLRGKTHWAQWELLLIKCTQHCSLKLHFAQQSVQKQWVSLSQWVNIRQCVGSLPWLARFRSSEWAQSGG